AKEKIKRDYKEFSDRYKWLMEKFNREEKIIKEKAKADLEDELAADEEIVINGKNKIRVKKDTKEKIKETEKEKPSERPKKPKLSKEKQLKKMLKESFVNAAEDTLFSKGILIDRDKIDENFAKYIEDEFGEKDYTNILESIGKLGSGKDKKEQFSSGMQGLFERAWSGLGTALFGGAAYAEEIDFTEKPEHIKPKNKKTEMRFGMEHTPPKFKTPEEKERYEREREILKGFADDMTYDFIGNFIPGVGDVANFGRRGLQFMNKFIPKKMKAEFVKKSGEFVARNWNKIGKKAGDTFDKAKEKTKDFFGKGTKKNAPSDMPSSGVKPKAPTLNSKDDVNLNAFNKHKSTPLSNKKSTFSKPKEGRKADVPLKGSDASLPLNQIHHVDPTKISFSQSTVSSTKTRIDPLTKKNNIYF
ncbi:MAG: hypothetical protein ACKOAD_02345, partial [Gammaproteobacteria bacterium]